MADEARLHDLLDLVEQARAEGDKETEAKATAAYKAESAPQASAKPFSIAQTLGDIGDAGKRYVTDYASGMKRAGQGIADTFSKAPIRSTLSIPGAILEQPANFVGKTIADVSAVGHSLLDKIPGSQVIGFDPNATFAQRKAEYEKGVGAYTDPQTNLGQNLSEALGATLKPVGDIMGLPGKAVGAGTKILGASPQSAQAAEEGTNAITNALLLAKSMRPQEASANTSNMEVKPTAKGYTIFINGKPSTTYLTRDAAMSDMAAIAKEQGTIPAKAPLPTKQELKQTAQQAYQRAQDTGAVVTGESFGKALGDVKENLTDDGLNSELHPATTAALKHISGHEGPVTIKQLDTYRKVAKSAQSRALSNSSESDLRLAGKLIDSIDKYAENLSSGDIVAGDAKAATSALNEARNLWSRYRKTDTIDELMNRAELRATQFSGSGLENSVRTEFRQLAMNAKKMKGFSSDEQAAIKKVAAGGPIENTLRMFGKAAPTGIVSAALGSGAGFAAGGPTGAVALPIVGGLSRLMAKKMTLANATRAQEIMRGGPGYSSPPNSPMLPFNVNPSIPAAASFAEMTPEQRRALIAQAIQ